MNELNGYDIEDLEPGMTATFSKTITDADIVLFAGASGDNNAIHINDEFAKTTPFNGRIAHGFLTASTISAAIANKLPGPGTIYISQEMNFVAPVRPGDTVHAEVIVETIETERCRANLPHFIDGCPRVAINRSGVDLHLASHQNVHDTDQSALVLRARVGG